MPPIQIRAWHALSVPPAMSHFLGTVPLLSAALIILTAIAIWGYRRRQASQDYAVLPDHDSKSISMADSWFGSVDFLPPPPGAFAFTSPLARDDMFSILNSGHLAAKADREQEAYNRASEAGKLGPWRRHSYPVPHHTLDLDELKLQQDGDTPEVESVKHDILRQFADPDLNGIWRRRILEFENC